MSERPGPEIRPHYLNEASELAEQRLRRLLEVAADLGVETTSLRTGEAQIIEAVRQKFPERYELVVQKLRTEGLDLADLPKAALIDRMLGIDLVFAFKDKNYAVDVTSGKNTVLKNKEKKFREMESLYRQLGIDRALVIRLKEDVTEDTVLDLFGKLEGLEDRGEAFTAVMRYPETKRP